MSQKVKIFFVDDDALYLKALEIEFTQNENFEIFTFDSGETCLKNLDKQPSLVVLDYHLNGVNIDAINGLETLDAIKKINAEIEVIMLSSQDKIEVAIECMHHHAVDYVVKSETAFLRIEKVIAQVLSVKKMKRELNWFIDKM
jgi:DNA-binding NtrC family response regulator